MYFVSFPFAFSVFLKNVIQNVQKISSKNEDVLCLYIINNVVVSV